MQHADILPKAFLNVPTLAIVTLNILELWSSVGVSMDKILGEVMACSLSLDSRSGNMSRSNDVCNDRNYLIKSTMHLYILNAI